MHGTNAITTIASFQKSGRRKLFSRCHQNYARLVDPKQWASYVYQIVKLEQAMKNVFILTGTMGKVQYIF